MVEGIGEIRNTQHNNNNTQINTHGAARGEDYEKCVLKR